jgi:DNA-binding SARP family transcriptional activator
MSPLERDGLKFEVLGPVAVRLGGRAVNLGTPKARRILALLLGRRNRAVSVDVLVESLWEAPPRTAAKNVQVYIHHLRRALGDPERIVRQRPGYRLVVRSGELDAERFEDLARQGLATDDPERASELFGQALALWKGDDAYADIVDVPVIHAEVYRLAETRMTVLLNRIDADLRLGRHAELLPELTGLTTEHPLREGLWARLMTALYRCGRQADALGAYDNARRALVEQAGLDPSPELQELQRKVLAASAESATATAGHAHRGPAATPETAAAASTHEKPRMLPPRLADLTGRTAELKTLDATLRQGRRIIAISGPGGVGKTALAVHLAHRICDTFDDGQLYADLAGERPEPADPAEVLGRFLRALGVAAADLPEDADERASAYHRLLARRRILIVLDDAADESQLERLLPGNGRCAVIVTSRVRLGLPGAEAVDLDVLPEHNGRRPLRGAGEYGLHAAPQPGGALALIQEYRQETWPSAHANAQPVADFTLDSVVSSGEPGEPVGFVRPARSAPSSPGDAEDRHHEQAKPEKSRASFRERRLTSTCRIVLISALATGAAALLVVLGGILGRTADGKAGPLYGSPPPLPEGGTAQQSAVPTITLNQTYGDGNSTFVVHCSGLKPGRKAFVLLDSGRASPHTPVVDARGTFNYVINQGHEFYSGKIPPGSHRVTVEVSGVPRLRAVFTVNTL